MVRLGSWPRGFGPTLLTILCTLVCYRTLLEQPRVDWEAISLDEPNSRIGYERKWEKEGEENERKKKEEATTEDDNVVCRPKCFLRPVGSEQEYHAYFTKMEATCSSWKKFGEKGAPWGGMKFVCLDPKFDIQANNCVVLSFGIDNEWSFDDDFAQFGCKVYSFDPTMGVADHQRSANVRFFSVGISNVDGERTVGMNNKFTVQKVSRFSSILQRLNLTNTIIDYVKMDVEWYELDFWQDMIFNTPHLLKNIKQIGMEVHDGDKAGNLGPKTLYQHFWFYYQLIRCHGFKLIHARKAGPWHEVVWAREEHRHSRHSLND